jgi:hypothetical protein
MVDSLREQFFSEEDDLEYDYDVEEEETGPPFLGLEPWQRFVLSIMLFLNVALCGMMGLVMMGKVVFQF